MIAQLPAQQIMLFHQLHQFLLYCLTSSYKNVLDNICRDLRPWNGE